MMQPHAATSNENLLEVQDLTKSYQGRPLLHGVTFGLARGEILCLLGGSGSGKTTLLRVIAGLERLEGGSIFFAGQDIRLTKPHRRRIGMMFQEYALFPHKTVGENVAFGLEMQKTASPAKKSKIEQMLALVGLSGFEDRPIDQLSGGERQRVALARSLAPEPQLLLLDEPLGSLDRTLRDRLAVEIREILKTLNLTAIFVTHDQAEAFSVADKVAVLHEGVLQQLDSPEGLYRYPASRMVASFLGFENLIDGLLDTRGDFQPYVSGLDGIQPVFSAAEQAGEATLLLRPDGARIAGEERGGVQLSGTVVASRFLGGSYSLTLQAGEVQLSFTLPIDPTPPPAGGWITLELNPASLVLLPAKKKSGPSLAPDRGAT